MPTRASRPSPKSARQISRATRPGAVVSSTNHKQGGASDGEPDDLHEAADRLRGHALKAPPPGRTVPSTSYSPGGFGVAPARRAPARPPGLGRLLSRTL